MPHHPPQQPKKPNPRNFVKKLYTILTTEDQNQISSCIAWTADGTGFQIENEVLFAEAVLARHYRHSNMPSFVRQLNMYGFRKVRADHMHYYYHPLFRKDNPQLVTQITRKPEKKLMELQNSQDQNRPIDSTQNRQLQQKSQRDKKRIKKVRFQLQQPQISQNSITNSLNPAAILKRPQQTQCRTRTHTPSQKSRAALSEVNSSLANFLDNKSQATIFNNNKDLSFGNDLLSICGNLEEPDQLELSRKGSGKADCGGVYWGLSEII